MFDIDLAAYNYGYKLKSSQLIDKIVVKRVLIDPKQFGYESVCYLNPSIQLKIPDYKYHVKAAGIGTANSKSISVYKSISEAFERWAYSTQSEFRSSAGFAAYPSLTGGFAKRNSQAELVERYCLKLFNEGKLNLKNIGDRQYAGKIKGYNFVLVLSGDSKIAYGFSCNFVVKKALMSAKIEMMRNAQTLSLINEQNFSSSSLQEKRLVYFSSKGFNDFSKKLDVCLNNESSEELPEIKTIEHTGPWSEYTKVYQSYFVDSFALNGDAIDYFYF